jgi:hypothetical protein
MSPPITGTLSLTGWDMQPANGLLAGARTFIRQALNELISAATSVVDPVGMASFCRIWIGIGIQNLSRSESVF